MACESQTKEINGKTVFCRQWPATKAMTMKARLMQLGGATIMPFVEGKPDLFAMMELEAASKPEELVQLIKDFVCEVRVDGEQTMPNQFDVKYQGNLWEVIELFAFACEVQYKSFFEQGLARFQSMQNLTQEM